MSDQKLLLLGMLRRQEMHGYQLFEFIERDLSACTDLKKPTAYYLLSKMAQDGWIEEEHFQEGNRPPRKVYHLTADGETAFQRLLRQDLASFDTKDFTGDLGLAFLDELEPQEALPLLEQRQLKVGAALENMQFAPVHHGSLQLVIERQALHLVAEMEWLENLIRRIRTSVTLS